MTNQQTPANEPTAETILKKHLTHADKGEVLNVTVIDYSLPKSALMVCSIINAMQEYADLQTATLRSENDGLLEDNHIMTDILDKMKAENEALQSSNEARLLRITQMDKVPPDFWERCLNALAYGVDTPAEYEYLLTICKNNINP